MEEAPGLLAATCHRPLTNIFPVFFLTKVECDQQEETAFEFDSMETFVFFQARGEE